MGAETSDLSVLFRKVVTGAAMASLDVAGSALLPGAWPILRAALSPVFERLSERFSGKDVSSSPELAERAAAEFERDQRLQELLRTGLLEQLDPILKGQEKIDADVQKLCLVVMGNSQALQRIEAGVGDIDTQLKQGVSLNQETLEQLTSIVDSRAAAMYEARDFARRQLSEAQPPSPGWLRLEEIKDRINTAEVEATALVARGEPDEAMARLRETQLLLARTLDETPTDVTLKILQGYLFKAQAQGTADTSPDAAARYLSLAEDAFNLVLSDLPSDQRSLDETASAINGLGNVYAERGDYEKAIELYREATSLEPAYEYAWHDLFAAYDALASQGSLDLAGMRHAYNQLCATADGYPNLDGDYLQQLGERLTHWEEHT
jgi:tetratricopeptide (TPR) repeat protein